MLGEFICLDVETTGLDVEKDQIIEIAVARFNMKEVVEVFESLINPGHPIPEESQKIHHICDEMVVEAPTIGALLPEVLQMIGDAPIVGHGIQFDIALLVRDAERLGFSHQLSRSVQIDTLRLARAYGESSVNSLDALRAHFNIEWQGAHRALADVHVNIEVFRKLAKSYKNFRALQEALSHPVLMKAMPFGKYKGRPFKEIPEDYLRWTLHKLQLDQDLRYSIEQDLKKRRRGTSFGQASSAFKDL